jgi:hypothetical protein
MKRLAIILALLISTNARGQDTQVTASIGSDTVGVQDQFQLTITVSGKDSGDAENPRFSHLQGFKIVSGPNISTQFQWINGRSSSSKSFIYILIPEKEGQFTIDQVEVRVGGKAYRTQQLQVRVTSAPRNPPAQPQRQLTPFDPFEEDGSESIQGRTTDGDIVLVRAELDRDSAYPGQQVTLFYRVYTQVGISGIQLQESPPLSGFWVEDIEVEKNPNGVRQVVNGLEYQAFTIRKQALFATTTGNLKIPPSVFAISAGVGGDFFGVFGRTETLYRKTQDLFLDVNPLPTAGRPADFSNAVGSFNLTANIDKGQAATGEAVALHVKLEGRGNLKMIPDISFPPLPDFTTFSSKHANSIRSLGENQIGGDKTWEYVIVPKAPGRQTIPPFSFSYFNVDRNKYETLTTPSLSLNVVRGADSSGLMSGLSGSDKQDLIRRGTDINFIKLSPGGLEREREPLYRNLWFYLIAAIPLAFNAGAFLYQRQRSRLIDDKGFVRSRRAKRNAFKLLELAEKEGKSDARRFYDQAATALSGYLADRFNLTEIELTGDHLDRTLSENAVLPEAARETKDCLQECDFGRFVSASNSADKMLQLSKRIRRTIDALERTTADSHQFHEPRLSP